MELSSSESGGSPTFNRCLVYFMENPIDDGLCLVYNALIIAGLISIKRMITWGTPILATPYDPLRRFPQISNGGLGGALPPRWTRGFQAAQ